jgi:hypothetical protein
MVVNFKARGISPGARKLTRTPTLIIIIKKIGEEEEKEIVGKTKGNKK